MHRQSLHCTAVDTQCRSLVMLQSVWPALIFPCGREQPICLIQTIADCCLEWLSGPRTGGSWYSLFLLFLATGLYCSTVSICIFPPAYRLTLSGVLLTAVWVPGQGCSITSTQNRILAISFIYSMVFDFIVLCLTAYKLLAPRTGRSRLVGLIFGDGLIYFVIA